jgi:DNA-directed RNA polymerase I, II, and III subunit RPABC2
MSDIEDDESVSVKDSDAESDNDELDIELEDDLEEKGGEEEDDDLEEIQMDDGENEDGIKKKPAAPVKKNTLFIEDNEEEEDDDNYLQKFDEEINKNYIHDFHPECLIHNSDEIAKLSIVMRNADHIIVDPLHKTLPFLTKYEKARVLGQRAKQIENGSAPFVNVPEQVIDGYTIAVLELKQKKIPFIIRRPIPGGAFEYWNLKDLECLI